MVINKDGILKFGEGRPMPPDFNTILLPDHNPFNGRAIADVNRKCSITFVPMGQEAEYLGGNFYLDAQPHGGRYFGLQDEEFIQMCWDRGLVKLTKE